MAFEFTWKVNMAVLSLHEWVGLLLLVVALTAPLSLPFTASICPLMLALSTSYASLARAQGEGTALEQEVALALVFLGAIISVSPLHLLCSVPLHETIWIPTT